MPEKLPVPPLESIQLLTQDVGSTFQGKMNSVVVALRNALIAFNAQIDAAETASQQVEPAPEDLALEGTNNTYKMTPLRSAQLIEKLLTDATADEAEALAGTSDKLITALLLDFVLLIRLGTAGNLGTAAQRNVMTSLEDSSFDSLLSVETSVVHGGNIASGLWSRYADGRLTLRMRLNSQNNTTNGETIYSFPIEFVGNDPHAQVTSYASGGTYSHFYIRNDRPSLTEIRMIQSSPANNFGYQIYIDGRWKE